MFAIDEKYNTKARLFLFLFVWYILLLLLNLFGLGCRWLNILLLRRKALSIEERVPIHILRRIHPRQLMLRL